MNLLSLGLLLVLGLLNIANGVEGSAAGTDEDRKRVYMDVLVSQGRVLDLKRREEKAREVFANVTSQLTQLQNKLADHGKGRCNPEEADAENIKKLKDIQEELKKLNKRLAVSKNESDSLENELDDTNEEIRTHRATKEQLTKLAYELEKELIRLEDVFHTAEVTYKEHVNNPATRVEGVSRKEQLERDMKKAADNYDEKHNDMRNNNASLKKMTEELAELMVKRDSLTDEQNKLEDRIEKKEAKLRKLETQEIDLEKKKQENISNWTKECNRLKEELEKEIREKEDEMTNAKNVVRMREANRMWIEKEVSEKRKKLDDMLLEKQKEEKRKGESERQTV